MTAATSIDEVLDTYGRGMTVDDLATILRDRLSALPDPAARALPTRERELLVSASGLPISDRRRLAAELRDPDRLDRAQRESAVAEATTTLASSLTSRQVAELLDIDISNVSRATASGRLYAIDIGGRRRFPSWQFVDGRPLASMPEVLQAVPRDLSPTALAEIMTRAEESLADSSPVQWLTDGGDPSRVTELLAGLDRW